MGEKKLHYKMYKDGKKFVFAAIATLSFFVFGGVSTVAVHADTGNLTASDSAKTDNDTTTAAAGDNTKTDNTATTTDTGNSTKTDNTATTTDTGNSTKTDNTATTTDTGNSTKTDNTATTAATGNSTKTDNTATTTAGGDSAVKTDTTSTASESSTKKDDVTRNTQQNTAIKTPSNLTDTDKNGIQTNWSRDKSADTGNSDSNSVSNEAGKYWPNTQGDSLKDYSKTTITDFTKDQTFDLGYNATPVLQNSSDLSLYIRGQRVDLSNLVDDDSLNGSAQYPGHDSRGHSRLISTSDLGENTYFWAKNVFKIYNEITHKYDRYDLKWTLESVNYGDANTQIALGIKGSQDSGGTQLLNIGSGWQLAHLGNFFNTHLQFFKEENESASNEDPALAIANADVTAAAVSIHMGFSDIDSHEAVQLTEGVIKKVYVDSATQLAYQDQNGYLSVTRKYNDPSDVSGKNESKVTFLMEMDVPVEGFDLSVATIGNQKDSSNNYIHGQGSKVVPSLLSTMKYTEPLVIVYNKLDGNGNTTTESLQSPKIVEGLIGNKYTVDSTGNKVDTSAPLTITDSDGNIWKLDSKKTQGNPNGSYVDGINEIDYYYQISKETAKVTYIDDTTDKTLSSQDLSGDYGTTDSYRTADSIKGYESQGYQLVSDNYPTNGVTYNEDGTVQSFEVHLTHGTTQTSESQTVNEVIHYVYKNGDKAADDYQATPLNFTRTVTTDKVTGKKTYGSWSADQSFAAVTSPAIKGYTPDQAQIDTITGITADSADIEKTVTYVANKETAKVTYIDDTTGKTLSSQDLSGDYGTTDSYRTADSIKGYESQGYQLVSDNYPTNGVTYNEDGTVQSFEVHLTHGTTQTSESQTVNEVIHYVYKNGDKAADDYQATPLNFTRTVTTDKVTGKKTYGSWSADQSFAAVTSPAIKGYTPDQAQIDTITGITADSADIEKTVTYVANKETAKVTYIDDTTGKTLSSQDLSGDYGTTDSYRTADSIKGYESQGYQLVSDNYPTNGVTYNEDGTVQSFEVHLTHGTTQTSESQTVNEVIHYVYKNGDKAADDYQATPLNFTRTVTTDKVTGKKTYGSWSADQSFAAVTSPAIKGYTPDQAQIDTITGITADSADIEKTVTYVANKETAKVTYIDDTTGKTLSSQDLSGDYGTTDSYRTADSIKGYESQGYQLVSDNYPTNGVTYNEDGTVQSFEVHLTHGTTQTSESQTVNEVIHYVYKNGDKAADDYQATPLNFTRTVTTDKVTGKKTYGSWSADQSFAAVTSPAIKGYTPDQAQIDTITGITADSADIEKTVTYVANKETAKVTYIDDTTGKTLSSQDLSGDYGTTDSYRTADSIKGYESQGYQLVSDNYPTNGVTYNEDGTVQSFEVHLTHGTTQTSESQTVNEVIHYVYKNGDKAADDYQATPLNFTRTVTTDKVTGKKTYGSWSADQSFAAVTSPAIKGYTPDQAQIDTITGITADSADIEKTVTYVANKETAKVTYIDDTTGKTLSSQDLSGDYGTTDSYRTADSIKGYESQGYQLVSDNYPTNGVTYNEDGTVQSFEVHLTHGTTQTSESQTVNEVIHYVYKNGDKAADDYQATPLNFTRTVTTDKVTGKKTYGSWSADQSFAAVTSPAIKGYTPDQAQIDTITGITADSADIEKTVTYVANKETAKVTYIDDTTGKTLSSQDLSGDYGTTDSYRTADSIKGYESQGYQLVSDNYPTNGVTYNEDGTVQSFEVHLTHGTTQTSESQTVNEVIHYVYKNGDKAADDYQATPLNFTRTVTTDKVTGKKTYGSWSADQSFAAVTSPAIKGYTPDQAQIDTITGITADSADIEKTVTYVANKETAKVTYIDDTTGKTLSSQDLSGDYGTTDSYRTADSIKGYESQGYQLVSDNYPTNGVTYNEDGTVQSFEVHLTHGTTQTSESQTVNEVIHYVYKNGDKAADDYQATPLNFTRTVTTDKVTGKKTYGSWSADQSFAAVTSPAIKGYTPDQAQIDTITGITADSADIEKTVTYVANKETAKVTYIDDTTGKTLSSQDLSGDYGTTDSYRTADSIKGYESQGYQLVSDNYPTNGVTYNEDGTVQSFEVHLTHGTTQTSESQTVNEVIHYVYKNGDKAADDYQATPLNFTRTVTTDKVTGKKTYGSWSADQSFAAVTSPELKGYTADKAQIDKQTVNRDSKDLEFKVTYTKNAPTMTTEKKTVNETVSYVDQNGNVLAQPHTASVDFTRQVSTDAVTGEKTYGPWSAAQSFAAVTSPELKGYTTDKAQIDKQTVNGDSKDLEFKVTYTKTPVAGGNVTAKYVDENGNPIADDVIASGNVGDPYSTTQKDVPGYTFKEVQGNPTGSFTDQDQTVTYVYTKNPATDNNGGTGLNQPGKPGNGTDTGNSSSNQPGNPSQPSNATNNGVINTSTNTGSKVNNGAVNSPELPQTGENNSQSQTMSFIGILLAMFGSLLGFLGIKKRRND
ncbi:MucBP domain-containing protein [Limosilactobacillus fermentum]|uniref:mucin-binding protein n=1 Tax=Limosilactobacillus fermentum TaxID=1613 RepID=UPI0033143519